MYLTKENEGFFEVYPIGIKYQCTHCKEGDMKVITTENGYVLSEPNEHGMRLIKHECRKCHKTLLLPKVYPYIEWNID